MRSGASSNVTQTPPHGSPQVRDSFLYSTSPPLPLPGTRTYSIGVSFPDILHTTVSIFVLDGILVLSYSFISLALG